MESLFICLRKVVVPVSLFALVMGATNAFARATKLANYLTTVTVDKKSGRSLSELRGLYQGLDDVNGLSGKYKFEGGHNTVVNSYVSLGSTPEEQGFKVYKIGRRFEGNYTGSLEKLAGQVAERYKNFKPARGLTIGGWDSWKLNLTPDELAYLEPYIRQSANQNPLYWLNAV